MSLQLEQNLIPADEKALDKSTHILFVLPPEKPSNLPFITALEAKLKRNHGKYADLQKNALTMDLPNGAFASWVALDAKHSVFKRHTSLRKAIKTLLDEKPAQLVIAVYGDEAFRRAAARDAYYVALVNAQILPTRKSQKDKSRPLKSIRLLGMQLDDAQRTSSKSPCDRMQSHR